MSALESPGNPQPLPVPLPGPCQQAQHRWGRWTGRAGPSLLGSGQKAAVEACASPGSPRHQLTPSPGETAAHTWRFLLLWQEYPYEKSCLLTPEAPFKAPMTWKHTDALKWLRDQHSMFPNHRGKIIYSLTKGFCETMDGKLEATPSPKQQCLNVYYQNLHGGFMWKSSPSLIHLGFVK